MGRIKEFYSKVAEGPVYTCTSCNQLWFKHSVLVIPSSLLNSESVNAQNVMGKCPKPQNVDHKIWVSATCKTYISDGNILPMSVTNKMKFSDQSNLKDKHYLHLDCHS